MSFRRASKAAAVGLRKGFDVVNRWCFVLMHANGNLFNDDGRLLCDSGKHVTTVVNIAIFTQVEWLATTNSLLDKGRFLVVCVPLLRKREKAEPHLGQSLLHWRFVCVLQLGNMGPLVAHLLSSKCRWRGDRVTAETCIFDFASKASKASCNVGHQCSAAAPQRTISHVWRTGPDSP